MYFSLELFGALEDTCLAGVLLGVLEDGRLASALFGVYERIFLRYTIRHLYHYTLTSPKSSRLCNPQCAASEYRELNTFGQRSQRHCFSALPGDCVEATASRIVD